MVMNQCENWAENENYDDLVAPTDEASLGAMTYSMPEPHYVMAAKRGEGYR